MENDIMENQEIDKKSTEYLFGITPDQFTVSLETQKKLFEERIEHSNKLVIKLMEPSYMIRDHDRIREVQKAVKWSEDRLKEIQEYIKN
jgi:hypothetical protein